jgi:hypothetical protein
MGPAEQVSEARQALMRVAEGAPGRWWTARELRRAAQNGFPSTVMSAAIYDLVESDALRLDSHLRIQLAQR